MWSNVVGFGLDCLLLILTPSLLLFLGLFLICFISFIVSFWYFSIVFMLFCATRIYPSCNSVEDCQYNMRTKMSTLATPVATSEPYPCSGMLMGWLKFRIWFIWRLLFRHWTTSEVLCSITHFRLPGQSLMPFSAGNLHSLGLSFLKSVLKIILQLTFASDLLPSLFLAAPAT